MRKKKESLLRDSVLLLESLFVIIQECFRSPNNDRKCDSNTNQKPHHLLHLLLCFSVKGRVYAANLNISPIKASFPSFLWQWL